MFVRSRASQRALLSVESGMHWYVNTWKAYFLGIRLEFTKFESNHSIAVLGHYYIDLDVRVGNGSLIFPKWNQSGASSQRYKTCLSLGFVALCPPFKSPACAFIPLD